MLRKIESAEEKAKREKRRNRLLIGVMLLLLLGSTAGYSFLSGDKDNAQKVGSNGVQNIGGQWAANYNGQTLYFSSSPETAKNISLSTFFSLQDYYQKSVYVVADTDSSNVNYEIASTLGQYTGRMQPACYGSCDKDLPEKNCTDYLIVWNSSAANNVYQKDNCVFIDGDITAIDAFLYKIFGYI
ncbi:hypothetical protein J4217_02395 [Candidatus Pacearchaeota archaeon]|nr:hypothetical protein [Candidatus Pacearchaeota archaeon]